MNAGWCSTSLRSTCCSQSNLESCNLNLRRLSVFGPCGIAAEPDTTITVLFHARIKVRDHPQLSSSLGHSLRLTIRTTSRARRSFSGQVKSHPTTEPPPPSFPHIHPPHPGRNAREQFVGHAFTMEWCWQKIRGGP